MGFSIGGLFKSILGVAAPIIGSAFGPLGTVVGGAIGSQFLPSPRPLTTIDPFAFRGPPRGVPVITGGSSKGPTIVGGGGVTTLPGGAPIFMAAGALIRELLRRASVAIGKRITRAGVLSLTREVGIVSAAAALALTAVEVAQIIAAKPTRRRRGITASQIATTKATMRRLDSLNRAIANACPPARRRRAPSRAAIHHAK